ncbi:MAG: threonine/serine dehydratase [Acidobacteria bacterium]|nr:threonine/serine dehydratase [Acidobacteriota bacterium]
MITKSALVSLAEIEAAAVRIRPAARITPLIEVLYPGTTATDATLFLKCENFQPMGAFKIRGAYNMVAQLSADELARGVITYSSGNHGQAVALAARALGAKAVIVMPTTAPKVKVEGARGYGAEVVFAGTTSLDRKVKAEEIAAERNLAMVPPFDHPMVIAGQGTVALEILDQCPRVGCVVVEVGGGGLSSGVSAAIKQRHPAIRVVGVEPEGAAKMKRSLEAGRPVTLARVGSIADGLMTVRPGDLTFEHVRTFVDEVVTVSDRDMIRAIAWLYRHARIVVEPSGAVTTAAVMLGLGGIDPVNGPVVAIISGGNVEAHKYAEYITS